MYKSDTEALKTLGHRVRNMQLPLPHSKLFPPSPIHSLPPFQFIFTSIQLNLFSPTLQSTLRSELEHDYRKNFLFLSFTAFFVFRPFIHPTPTSPQSVFTNLSIHLEVRIRTWISLEFSVSVLQRWM